LVPAWLRSPSSQVGSIRKPTAGVATLFTLTRVIDLETAAHFTILIGKVKAYSRDDPVPYAETPRALEESGEWLEPSMTQYIFEESLDTTPGFDDRSE